MNAIHEKFRQKVLRSCFELFEMFFEVKKLQTNNSKQLLNEIYLEKK